MKNLTISPLILTVASLALASCGKPDPSKLPVIHTAPHAKVDLSKISLSIKNAKIVRGQNQKPHLVFDYTLTNSKGSHLSFICLYRNTEELIDSKLTDQDEEPVTLGKRELEGLTLAEPRPMKILNGDTTRTLKIPISAEPREAGEPLNLQVRFHAPSRYDELRSTIVAPPVIVTWP